MTLNTISIILTIALFGACGGNRSPEPAPAPPVAEPPAPPEQPPEEEPGQPPGAEPDGDCVRSGCSGTACVPEGEEVFTTCEWREEYACFDDAVCERQPSGECGWTETPAYQACIEAATP